VILISIGGRRNAPGAEAHHHAALEPIAKEIIEADAAGLPSSNLGASRSGGLSTDLPAGSGGNRAVTR
jgi:hypothetical protein